MPQRRQKFPDEEDTKPGRRNSGPAPKGKESQILPPTMRPPKGKAAKEKDTHVSGTRSRKPPPKPDSHGAKVDVVVADMRKDPRREHD